MIGANKDKAKRLRLERALKEAAGAWKDEDHPELVETGTYEWVREIREETERRIQPKEVYHVES